MQQGKRKSAVRKSTYMDSNDVARCLASRLLVKQAIHSNCNAPMEALSMPPRAYEDARFFFTRSGGACGGGSPSGSGGGTSSGNGGGGGFEGSCSPSGSSTGRWARKSVRNGEWVGLFCMVVDSLGKGPENAGMPTISAPPAASFHRFCRSSRRACRMPMANAINASVTQTAAKATFARKWPTWRDSRATPTAGNELPL